MRQVYEVLEITVRRLEPIPDFPDQQVTGINPACQAQSKK
jgi:hypothetical protein